VNWTEEEIAQISNLVADPKPDTSGKRRFVYDHHWQVVSVVRCKNDHSIAEVTLMNELNSWRLIVALHATRQSSLPKAPADCALTDQVFYISIRIDEFVNIIGLDGFIDGSTLQVDVDRSVYDTSS